MKTIATLLATVAVLFGMTPTANAAPERDQRVVVFGDSITFGVGTKHPEKQSWAALIGARRVARSGGCLVVDNCFGRTPAINDYDRRVLTNNPDVVVLAYGINDLLAGGSTREFIRGARTIIRENRELGIRTYVATVTPIRMGIDFDPTRVLHNDALRKTFGWRVIDFDTALIGPNGNLPRRYDSGDGIHPSALGYAKMAKAARAAMQ